MNKSKNKRLMNLVKHYAKIKHVPLSWVYGTISVLLASVYRIDVFSRERLIYCKPIEVLKSDSNIDKSIIIIQTMNYKLGEAPKPRSEDYAKVLTYLNRLEL